MHLDTGPRRTTENGYPGAQREAACLLHSYGASLGGNSSFCYCICNRALLRVGKCIEPRKGRVLFVAKEFLVIVTYGTVSIERLNRAIIAIIFTYESEFHRTCTAPFPPTTTLHILHTNPHPFTAPISLAHALRRSCLVSSFALEIQRIVPTRYLQAPCSGRRVWWKWECGWHSLTRTVRLGNDSDGQ
jgi:hypothetical protein